MIPEHRGGDSEGNLGHHKDATRGTPRLASRLPKWHECFDKGKKLFQTQNNQKYDWFITLVVLRLKRSSVRKKLSSDTSNCLSIYTRVRSQAFLRLTRMDSAVHTSVTEGEMEGRTVCWNSWTNPPVMEARGRSASCSNFSFTPEQVHDKCLYCETIILCTLLSGQEGRWSLTNLH